MTLEAAYNEFIRDYCDRHDACQATRDEAHEEADKLVALGKSLAAAVKAFGGDDDMLSNLIAATYQAVDRAELIEAAANA